MKEIPLAGKYGHLVTLVDDEDFDLASSYSWQHLGGGRVSYARRSWVDNGRRRSQFLHSMLTGWPEVDHMNHDGLDNRRINLRMSSHRENSRNQRKRRPINGRTYSSEFKGVGAHQGRWRSYIKVDGLYKHIGTHLTEEEAARSYDAAARVYFGEYAQLNFKEDQ